MAEFYHIFIEPKAGVTKEQVQKKLDLAVDWFRYHKGVYIIYTTSDANTWYRRLEEFVKPEGSVFVCRLDVTKRNGWMTRTFWDWVKKDRTASLQTDAAEQP